MKKLEDLILEALASSPEPMTVVELAEACECTDSGARLILGRLKGSKVRVADQTSGRYPAQRFELIRKAAPAPRARPKTRAGSNGHSKVTAAIRNVEDAHRVRVVERNVDGMNLDAFIGELHALTEAKRALAEQIEQMTERQRAT